MTSSRFRTELKHLSKSIFREENKISKKRMGSEIIDSHEIISLVNHAERIFTPKN